MTDSLTCLTNLVRQGNELVLAAEIAGHKRLETTRRYSLPSAKDCESDGRFTGGLQISSVGELRGKHYAREALPDTVGSDGSAH